MKWERFKNRFKKDAHQEKVEVDASAIWEAIASDVEALNQKKLRRRRFIFWLLGTGFALGGLAGFLHFNLSEPETTLVQNQSSPIALGQEERSTAKRSSTNIFDAPTITPSIASQADGANSSLTFPQLAPKTNATSGTQDQGSKPSAFDREVRPAKALKSDSVPSLNLNDRLRNTSSPKSTVETETTSSTITKIQKRTVSNEADLPETSDPIPGIVGVEDHPKQSRSGLTNLEQKQLFVKEKPHLLSSLFLFELKGKAVLDRIELDKQQIQLSLPDSEFAEAAARKNKRNRNRFFVSASGGLSFINRSLVNKNNLSSVLLQNRAQSERPLEAMQYGLSFGLQHRSGLRFSLGIQHTSIAERFEFTETRTAMDLIEGVLTLRINTLGDTIPIMGMLPRTTTTTTQIEVYNTYQLIDIPLSIAYYHAFNEKWVLGLEAMIAANLSLKTAGSIVDENELELDIKSNQSTLFRSRVGLNYQFGLAVERMLSDKLALSVAPFIRIFPKDFSVSTYAIAQKYTLLGGRLGLMYRF
ncbi:MAG: hypothetical protein AAF985_05820 [Bacteroidota bacterium]